MTRTSVSPGHAPCPVSVGVVAGASVPPPPCSIRDHIRGPPRPRFAIPPSQRTAAPADASTTTRALTHTPDTDRSRTMTNPTTPAAPRRPVWAAEPCPSWCETSFHTDNQAPSDRFHYSAEDTVPLRHEKAVETVGGTWHLDVLKLFLSLEYRGGETARTTAPSTTSRSGSTTVRVSTFRSPGPAPVDGLTRQPGSSGAGRAGRRTSRHDAPGRQLHRGRGRRGRVAGRRATVPPASPRCRRTG